MATPALTTTINSYPNGHSRQQNTDVYKGTIAIASGGTYPANGLPWTLSGDQVTTDKTPHWGEGYSISSGYVYRFDPTHQTWRIFVTGTAANDPLNELATSGTVAADTIYFRVEVQNS